MRETCSLTPNLKRMQWRHSSWDLRGGWRTRWVLQVCSLANGHLGSRGTRYEEPGLSTQLGCCNGAAARQPAWGFSTLLFFDALMMVEMVIISHSYQNSFRKASLIFLSANYKSVPVSGQGLSLADLRYLEEKAKQLHQEGRASSKGDVSDWDGVYR